MSRRNLSKVSNIDRARERAKRALPHVVFDFIDGGADDEVTLDENCRAYRDIFLVPRVGINLSEVDLGVDLFGTKLSMPVVLAPCGGTRMVAPDGDCAVARAAGRVGTASVMSTASATSIEDVASAATGPTWFQLYLHGGRELSEQLIIRALESGMQTLVVTVDTAVRGNHDRIKAHEAVLPLAPTVRNALRFGPQLARRPRWTLGYLRDGIPTDFGSFPSGTKRTRSGSGTWEDLGWLREIWPGPFVVKGILSSEDAKRALSCGADGIVVSNHGGRQLDFTPSTLSVLPEVRQSVGDAATVLIDGGVRRGSDVVKALALGANAVLIGRPYLYGLAVGGENGVVHILDILREEMTRVLTLLGRGSVAELGREVLRTGAAS